MDGFPILSVVIPYFNERARLEPIFNRLLQQLASGLAEPFELILVDDGSTDGTRQMLQRAHEALPQASVVVISYPTNQGKGFAVKTGVLQASGECILVMDADGSVDVAHAAQFARLLKRYDVVIGTKKHLLAETIEGQQAPRRILGKGFTVLADLMLGLRFTDITCGFKAFRASVAKPLFERLVLRRWAYDAELLFLATRRQHRIFEAPVRWRHIEGSKVRVVRDLAGSLRDLAWIRLRYAVGRYSAPAPVAGNGKSYS